MEDKRFDPKKLHKLNNPERLKDIPVEYIWNKLDLNNPLVLIDIGAGTGFFSMAFAAYLKNGKVFACDISDIMVNWMENNVCAHHPNIVALKMEENSVPLEDCVADLVYMINLHHELDAPEEILNEAFRLLKENGKIFVVDWKKVEISEGPPNHIRCLPEEVEKQLIGTGFRKIAVYNQIPKHFLVVAEKQTLYERHL
jgi:ubiquinone/menaquinone biosynthesis C-methylase UbiE